MQSSSTKPLHLTSKTLTPSSDGNYAPEIVLLLRPHEAIRREMAYLSDALRKMDCIGQAWQAKCILECIADFLIPMTKAHRTMEESVLFPFYTSLSIALPLSQSESHIEQSIHEKRLVAAGQALAAAAGAVAADPIVVEQAQTRLREVFQAFYLHIDSRLSDLERFWSSIIKQSESAKVAFVQEMELSLSSYFHNLGELKADDGARLLFCSILHAMGISSRHDNAIAGQEESRWASVMLQEQIILQHSYYFQYVTYAAWNKRYLDYEILLSSLSTSSLTSAHTNLLTSPYRLHHNKYVPPLTKSWSSLVIIFTLMCGLYCLTGLPFFAAVSNPLPNWKYLHVMVVDFDQQDVGRSMVQFFQDISKQDIYKPHFDFVHQSSSSSLTIKDYEDKVMQGEAWAVVYAKPNATLNLQQALSNQCDNNYIDVYNPSLALGFSFDQGRSAPTANQYVAGFLGPQLTLFTDLYASDFMSTLDSSSLTSCQEKGYSSILTQPIAFTTTNLSPISKSYMAHDGALIIGNILVAVFGANYIVMGGLEGTKAIGEDYSGAGRVWLRCISMVFFAFGLACCFATTVIGLTYDSSSGYLFSGAKWVQMMAVQWLHMLVWCFFFSFLVVKFPKVPAFASIVMIIYNVTGGWNTDMATQGLKHFFQIFPYHWAISLHRCIFFGSLCYRRGISASILIAYLLFFGGLYVFFSLVKEGVFNRTGKSIPTSDSSALESKTSMKKESHNKEGDGAYEMVPIDEELGDGR